MKIPLPTACLRYLVPALATTASLAVMLSGCGKPASQGGGPPMGDFPVNAVVAKAVLETIPDHFVTVGTLEPLDAITLITELDSTVLKIHFKDGDAVTAGHVLIELDDTRAQAKTAEAEAAFRLAELTHRRSVELIERNTISQQELDQAFAEFQSREAGLILAREDLEKTRITAPFPGRVGERRVSVGQFVTRGQILTELTRVDTLEVTGDIPERHLDRLKTGLPVQFHAEIFSTQPFTGEVTYIAPVVDRGSRTVRIKASIANEDLRLRPGMFGKMDLVLGNQENAVVIPDSCLIFQENIVMVMAVGTDGRTRFQVVRTGRHLEGRVVILEGLAEGEWVVVEGHQKMGPGTAIIATEASSRYGVTPGPLAHQPEPAT